MRVFTALALFVCLAGPCFGEDWLSANHAGSEAFRQGRWSDSLEAFQKALPLAVMPEQQAITLNDIGAALHTLGRPAEAVPFYRGALELWRQIGSHNVEAVEAGLGLAESLHSSGDFRGAEAELRKLLTSEAPVNYKSAVLNKLADLLREQARKGEARQRFEETLALQDLPLVREIDARLGLGDIERETGNRTHALALAEKAMAIARTAGDQTAEALALRLMGRTWADAGDFARAEPALRKSLVMFQQMPIHPARQIAAGLNCVAAVYRDEGKFGLAEEAWLEAMALEKTYSGERHPQRALFMESLAGLYALQKRFGEAAELASAALSIMTEAFGADSMATAGALATVAYVAQGEKRYDAAVTAYAQAIGTFRAQGDPADRHILETKKRYAEVLSALHRDGEAKRLRQEVKASGFR